MSIEAEPTQAASPAAPKTPASRRWLHHVRQGVKAKIFGTALPDDPVRIGRYVVIKRIGAGGMGLIYAAYDDALDRKVAVKLLRPERLGSGSTGQARLLREAQAIARLSHPCVVSVYEVGALEDGVFIAMEYVDGETLKVRQATWSWREIVLAYIAAGRGLAAAHAAGIVHRDFKADNVLVRKDGAVRVLDFGLARTEFGERDVEVEAVAGTSMSSPDLPLTHTGTVMGTPAYMAPEQHLGQRTDARTDQFSFCVSLYEALYGYRPFAGSTLHELRDNVLRGNVEPEPRYTEVPASIRRTLQQGLHPDPAERFPTLEALLRELVPPDAKGGRWRWAAVAAGLLTAAAAGTLWWNATEDAQLRREGETLRAKFEQTRIVNAEAELRRLRQRSVSERWDDLVLTYAEEAVAEAPTVAVAALKHLTPDNDGWLDAARTIAAEASRRGPVFRQRMTVGPVHSVAFDAAGDHVLAHGRDGRVHKWRFADDQLVTLAPPPDVALAAVALADDGEVWGAGSDGNLHRIGPDATAAPIEVSEAPLHALAVSGDLLAVGDANGIVHLVRADGTIDRSLKRHTGPVRTLVFHPEDATKLASGGDDAAVWVSFLERRTNWTLEHFDASRHVRWTNSGALLLNVAPSGSLYAWDDMGRDVALRSFPEGADALDVDYQGSVTVYALADRVEASFDEAMPLIVDQHDATVHAVAASTDGTWVAAGIGDRLQLWRTGTDDLGRRPTGEIPIETTDGPLASVTHLGGGELLTISRAGTVRRWDAAGSSAVAAKVDVVAETVQLAPNGRDVAIEDDNGAVHVLDLSNPKGYTTLGRVREHRQGPMAWAPNSGAIVKLGCASEPTCLVAIYPADGGVPRQLADIAGAGRAVRYSEDAQRIVSDHDSGMWLWDVHTGEGRRIELPRGARSRERIAFAFVDRGQALRVAVAEGAEGERPAIRVFQTGAAGTRVHQLFAEAELARLVADDGRRAVLMETSDGRVLAWFLDQDHFALLPDGVLPTDVQVTRLRASDDRKHVLLDLDGGRRTLLIDLASGQQRTLPALIEPVVWSDDGTVVDLIHLRRLRKWVDPAPGEPRAFLAWLDRVTAVTVPAAELR